MQLINTIAMGIAFIAATASALPRELKFQNKQFSGNPFQVTDLIIDSVEDGDVAIAFTVYDPDPLANTTTKCAAHWPYGSNDYPQAIYKSCGNTSVAWHMQEYEPVEDFENGIDFTIELKDTFKDPTVGKAPYDRVTIFGKAQFTDNVISCFSIDNSSTTCTQAVGSTILAPIDRSIAKR